MDQSLVERRDLDSDPPIINDRPETAYRGRKTAHRQISFQTRSRRQPRTVWQFARAKGQRAGCSGKEIVATQPAGPPESRISPPWSLLIR